MKTVDYTPYIFYFLIACGIFYIIYRQVRKRKTPKIKNLNPVNLQTPADGQNKNNKFLKSYAIGYFTGDGMLGGALGGSYLGGKAGQDLSNNNFN